MRVPPALLTAAKLYLQQLGGYPRAGELGVTVNVACVFPQEWYLFGVFPLSFLLHIWNESEIASDENRDKNDEEDLCI